jgi:8-oxo-dGTP pyrophosphatase MutT (NUDIX family)
VRFRRALLDPVQAAALEVRGTIQAAVLVPLFERDGLLHVVFTKRRADLRRHPGEISFPGGRRDPGDPDLPTVALREAEEEIGLRADQVELIGALGPTPTIATGFAIYPFVGRIEPNLTWTPSATEVDRVLELAVPDLRAGYARRNVVRRGLSVRADTYLIDGHLIWGATARIVDDLLSRIG